MKRETCQSDAAERRERAEAAFLERTAQTPESLDALSPEAARSLLHELREQQIELEMRNEELRRALSKFETRDEYQQELQESEARYRRIVTTSEEGIWTIDAEARTDFVNPKMAEMLGYSVEEMLGRPLEEFMEEEARKTADDNLKRRRRGIAEQHEFKFLRKDGSFLWTSMVTSPITDAGGTYVGALAMVTDITERKLAETALAAERTRLRTVLDLLPMSVYVKDTRSRFVVVNEGSAKALGESNWEDMIGKTDADYFPPETAATFLEDEQRVLAGESVLNLVESSQAPDGTMRTELTSKVPLRDGEGNIVGLVGASRDITDSKHAEEALRLANQKLRLHFEQSPMAVIEWDLDFRVTRWNPAAATIFGFSDEEAVGRHASFIVPEAVRPHVDRIWQALVEKRGGTRSTNENVRKDGSTILCEWYNTPLIDEREACTGVASLVVDVTRRHQEEAELLKSKEELERRVVERTAKLRELSTELIQVEERERLRIADTLHEGLLQLLAAGRVRLGMLKSGLAEGISAADFDELLQCFDESIRMGRTLTHELYPPALQTLGLGAALGWLGQWHHDNYGLSVSVEVEAEIDIEEMELRIMLFRAANELLNNVRKHAAVEQAEVNLRLDPDGRVRLAVSDSGVGFDPKGVRAREGSLGGFGLFSLRERVEALGGAFEMDSAPGQGCCITVSVAIGKREGDAGRGMPVEAEADAEVERR